MLIYLFIDITILKRKKYLQFIFLLKDFILKLKNVILFSFQN